MIGVISDTHDNVTNIMKAVELFKSYKVEFVVHCGDIIAPATIQFFSGLKMKFVKGNCDGDIVNLKNKIKEIGGEFSDDILVFNYKNKVFCVYHGHDKEKLNELVSSQKYDYLLVGHTHQRIDKMKGRTRLINPGGHYPTVSEKTIALINDDTVKFIKI